MVREEIASRAAANERARLKAAGFPAPKTLDGFDIKASALPSATFEFLASLEWLERRDNLCLAGPAGVGKSRLPQALGRAASPPGARSASSRPTSRSRRSTAALPTTPSAS